ncbi:MAG: MBL fold metallo-hydrolase, partial [Actinomycetota bacterium]|nr:MBL fold metallo-hydrolase [Actinomycetota bacterium]
MESGLVGLEEGVLRVTFALPLGIDHVHCYLLRDSGGAWTLVDTGLGLPDAEERWTAILEELDAPVARIVVSHFHPDHIGAAAIVARLTDAPVHQGRLDYEQCQRVWGTGRSVEAYAAYMVEHGMPEEDAGGLRRESDMLADVVHLPADPHFLDAGDEVDGWEILHLPGHADGHLGLLREGVLIAGDALLATISPNVGLYPGGRPDPLGDYLDSLGRIAELAPSVAYAGHGPTIADPAARARELVEHHRERLERTRAALDGAALTAYEISL